MNEHKTKKHYYIFNCNWNEVVINIKVNCELQIE